MNLAVSGRVVERELMRSYLRSEETKEDYIDALMSHNLSKALKLNEKLYGEIIDVVLMSRGKDEIRNEALSDMRNCSKGYWKLLKLEKIRRTQNELK